MGHPSPQTRGVTDYGVLGFRKKGRRHHVRMNLVSVSRSLLGQGASPRQWTKEEGDEEALGWCRTTIAHERFILNLDVAVHQDVDEPNECGCAQRPCAHHDPLQLSPLVQASYVGRPGRRCQDDCLLGSFKFLLRCITDRYFRLADFRWLSIFDQG